MVGVIPPWKNLRMEDTRFTTVANDSEQLLDVVEIDDIDDVETLLIMLFDRPFGVDHVTNAEEGSEFLEVFVYANDEAVGCTVEFPLSVIGLVRERADMADDLGPYCDDAPATGDVVRIADLDDSALISALHDALGRVRIYNLLEDDDDVVVTKLIVEPEHVPYDVPRGACRSCGSGDVTHILAGMPVDPFPVVDYPEWLITSGATTRATCAIASRAVSSGASTVTTSALNSSSLSCLRIRKINENAVGAAGLDWDRVRLPASPCVSRSVSGKKFTSTAQSSREHCLRRSVVQTHVAWAPEFLLLEPGRQRGRVRSIAQSDELSEFCPGQCVRACQVVNASSIATRQFQRRRQ